MGIWMVLAGGFILLALIWMTGKVAVRWIGLLAILLVIGTGVAHLVMLAAGDPQAAHAGRLFPRPEDTGYATSTACVDCHVDQHASWHASFHRTMTQMASPETVVAPFDDVRLAAGRVTASLSRRGDEFWVDFVDPEWELQMLAKGADTSRIPNVPRRQAKVVMTTGSHHFQAYWIHSKYGRELWQFPWRYHIAEKRWIHRKDVFLLPPDWKPGEEFQAWNRNCILCHSTGSQPGMNQKSGFADFTKVAELGIACEACHGPGERHAAKMRGLADSGQSLTAGDSSLIVNPENLSHELSSEVCGRCHSHFKHTDEDLFVDGTGFVPGNPLRKHGDLLTVRDQTDDKRRFWSDGTNLSGGREFAGMLKSACYLDGQMSCLSCHTMHGGDPDDQLRHPRDSNDDCLSCHESFRDRIAEHTHHSIDSQGSRCVNCHMAHTSFALLRGIRNHRIDRPQVTPIRSNGRPNACNLCHLDKTLAWTDQHLADWYGQERVTLDDDEQTVAASVLWALRGDPPQRALMAWHLGWQPAQQASGTDWLTPYLAELMADPYAAVRFNAHQSLRSLPGFEKLRMDFDKEPNYLDASRDALSQWAQQALDGSRSAASRQAVLLEGPGQLQGETYDRIRRKRDPQDVQIIE